MIEIINQIYEIQKKANEQNFTIFDRNIKRIHHELENLGYRVIVPLQEIYKDGDTSVEASLTSLSAKVISKVIKPVIYKEEGKYLNLVQKGIVIVE